jgi:hypothetical protein
MDDHLLWRIVDTTTNVVIAGERWDLSLDRVEELLTKREEELVRAWITGRKTP